MITLHDWLLDLSRDYSVQCLDDIDSGVFVARVKGDVYLVNHAEVMENA